MSGFTIYFFVVTGLYILYMGVVVMMDLFGKKGQKKDDAEEFNNSDMGDGVDHEDEDEGTFVDEAPGGYSTRSSNAVIPVEEEEYASDEPSDEVEEAQQEVADSSSDEELLEQESMESKQAYESLKAVQEQMDDIVPHYQEEYRSDDFAAVLSQSLIGKSSRILIHYVNENMY